MDDKEILQLLERYNHGHATPHEQALIETWYLNQKEIPINQSFDELAEDLTEIQHHLEEYSKEKRVKLWPRFMAIAASLVIIFFGLWLFKASRNRPQNKINSDFQTNQITPGKNTATLTINSLGKAVTLSDAKTGVVIDASRITYNDGTVIGNAETRALTIATPRGGTYQVRLPDGTNVWLNADTKLTYTAPIGKHSGIRQVELIGEAYFEVFKNKQQPFVVNTKKINLTVLGTHFNLSAYNDEPATKATLLEGSIKVRAKHMQAGTRVTGQKDEELVLSPNQQASVSDGSEINVKLVKVANAVAWQKGYFEFHDENVHEIMRKVARWYDVEVIYEGDVPLDEMGGTISRFENVSKVLEIMQSTGLLKFRIVGKKVFVSKST